MFNLSLLKPLDYRPWRYDGADLQSGQDGSDSRRQANDDRRFYPVIPELVVLLKANLTPAEKAEIDAWVYPATEAQAALWHIPVWAGETSAVYFHIPSTVWNDPLAAPRESEAILRRPLARGGGMTRTPANGKPDPHAGAAPYRRLR